jgi:hypothetical protein
MTTGRSDDEAVARRRAFRAFARAHHPDLGGDAAVFAAGLTVHHAQQGGDRPPRTGAGGPGVAPVTLYRRGGLIVQFRRRWRRRRARHHTPRVR